jgi:hypothetical protein
MFVGRDGRFDFRAGSVTVVTEREHAVRRSSPRSRPERARGGTQMTISTQFAQGDVWLDPMIWTAFKESDPIHLTADESNGKVPKAYKGAKRESKIGLKFNAKNVLFIVSCHWGAYPRYSFEQPDFQTYEAICEGNYYAIVCGRVSSNLFQPLHILKISTLCALQQMKTPISSPSPQPAVAVQANNSSSSAFYCNATPLGGGAFYETPKPITTTVVSPISNRQPTPFEINSQLNAAVIVDAKVGGKRQVSRVFIIAP